MSTQLKQIPLSRYFRNAEILGLTPSFQSKLKQLTYYYIQLKATLSMIVFGNSMEKSREDAVTSRFKSIHSRLYVNAAYL
jgi:hypothetical protein